MRMWKHKYRSEEETLEVAWTCAAYAACRRDVIVSQHCPGEPNENREGKGLECSFQRCHIVLWSFKESCASSHYLICSDVVAENSNDRKL